MRTKILIYLVIPVIFLSFACEKNKSKSGKILNVTMSLAEDEWRVMRKSIFPLFEGRNECSVKSSEIAASELPKLLEASRMAGKSSIDVFSQDNMQLSILVKRGLVMDLSSEEKNIPDKVIKALIDAGRFEEKLFFMPYRPNVQIMYYNEKKFKKYGLSPPKTWQELLKVAKTFKDKEGVGKVLLKAFGGIPTVTQMYEFIVSAGGDPLQFNDEGCVKTFEFFKKLWPYASPDSKKAKWDTSNDYLARDSCYLMQNWPFGYKIVVEKYGKKEISVYPGIRGPKRQAHVIGGEVLGIPVNSGNKGLALKFISFMQTKEVQSIMVKELGWPSIREDVYEDIRDGLKTQFSAVKGALKHGIFRKNVPYWSEFAKLFNEAYIEIIINGKDAKQTLDDYHTRLLKIKKQYDAQEKG